MERTRTRVFDAVPAHLVGWSYGMDLNPDRRSVYFVSRETTIDEEHPWKWFLMASKRSSTKGYYTHVDMGGEFTNVKTSGRLITDQPVALFGYPYKDGYLHNFKGPLIPARPPFGLLRPDVTVDPLPWSGVDKRSYDHLNGNPDAWPSAIETDEELAVLGASLVSKLAPTPPHNSVYTSLRELQKDGLPLPLLSLIKGGSLPQGAAGEYLNYQFGIAPTLSDINQIRETISKAEKLWKQYLRDSGRLVRRRMDMEPTVEVTTGVFADRSDYIPAGTKTSMWSYVGPIMMTTRTERKRWFSAAYMYYVSEDSLKGMSGFLEKSNYLYGWKPDPSAYWNLTSWSWLVDWFTNTGDVIDNVSLYLNDPFLTRRAYIMEETLITRQFTQNLRDKDGGHHHAAVEFTTHVKKRRKVNPFHFGLTEDALDARQLSILAALGLTKFSNPGSM